MKWIKAEDGRLVLSGTAFSIYYDAQQEMPFRLLDNRKHETGYNTLRMAKYDAEWKAEELAELGLPG